MGLDCVFWNLIIASYYFLKLYSAEFLFTELIDAKHLWIYFAFLRARVFAKLRIW